MSRVGWQENVFKHDTQLSQSNLKKKIQMIARRNPIFITAKKEYS